MPPLVFNQEPPSCTLGLARKKLAGSPAAAALAARVEFCSPLVPVPAIPVRLGLYMRSGLYQDELVNLRRV